MECEYVKSSFDIPFESPLRRRTPVNKRPTTNQRENYFPPAPKDNGFGMNQNGQQPMQQQQQQMHMQMQQQQMNSSMIHPDFAFPQNNNTINSNNNSAPSLFVQQMLEQKNQDIMELKQALTHCKLTIERSEHKLREALRNFETEKQIHEDKIRNDCSREFKLDETSRRNLIDENEVLKRSEEYLKKIISELKQENQILKEKKVDSEKLIKNEIETQKAQFEMAKGRYELRINELVLEKSQLQQRISASTMPNNNSGTSMLYNNIPDNQSESSFVGKFNNININGPLGSLPSQLPSHGYSYGNAMNGTSNAFLDDGVMSTHGLMQEEHANDEEKLSLG